MKSYLITDPLYYTSNPKIFSKILLYTNYKLAYKLNFYAFTTISYFGAYVL